MNEINGLVAPSNLMRYHFAPPMDFIKLSTIFEPPEIAYDYRTG